MMKRKIVLSLFIVVNASLLFAQKSLPFSKPVTIVWAQTADVKFLNAGQDVDNVYLYQREAKVSRKASEDHLFVFNKTTLDFDDITVNIPARYQFVGSINREEEMLAFYMCDDPKAGTISLYSAHLNKLAKAVGATGKSIVSFLSENRDYPTFNTAVSPNGDYYAITFQILDKKSVLKNLYAVVLDREGKVVWKREITPNFQNPDFFSDNMQVSNDGTVYLPAYSMTIKNNSATNENLHLIQVKDKLFNMNTVSVDFGSVQSIKALILKNGDVFVGGYYSQSYEKNHDEAIGYYGYRYSPETGSYTVTERTAFPANYREKKVPALIALVLANQQYEISCDYLFELDNGNVVMTGEHRFCRSVTGANNMKTYVHLNKNILVTTFHPDGKSDFTMIEKRQGANNVEYHDDFRDLFLSYTAYATQNDVHFIYNDVDENVPYPGDLKFCETFSMMLNNRLKGVCTVLSPGGTITQKVLIDAASDKQQLHRLLFVDGKNFYVVAGHKTGYCLDKFEQ